jgi:hypothetical protein
MVVPRAFWLARPGGRHTAQGSLPRAADSVINPTLWLDRWWLRKPPTAKSWQVSLRNA